jgi:hypothetical protein
MSAATLTAIGMPRTMTTCFKLVLLALSVVVGWWGLSSFDYERVLSPTALAQWLNDTGPWAPLLLIGSMVCAVIIPPIPNLPLDLAAGAAVDSSKTFFKVTPMFGALLLALLLIVGIGNGWVADEQGGVPLEL